MSERTTPQLDRNGLISCVSWTMMGVPAGERAILTPKESRSTGVRDFDLDSVGAERDTVQGIADVLRLEYPLTWTAEANDHGGITWVADVSDGAEGILGDIETRYERIHDAADELLGVGITITEPGLIED